MSPEVEAWFASVPVNRLEHVRALHDLILSVYPDAEVDLSYKMPTYRSGDGWVALANQKRYVSLYTCSAAHIAAFKQRHGEIRTGTGCINFKRSDVLPIDDIAAVIRHAIEHPKGG